MKTTVTVKDFDIPTRRVDLEVMVELGETCPECGRVGHHKEGCPDTYLLFGDSDDRDSNL